ncbi:MAG: hypothetical protein LBV23_09715 [Deltaproteobacteria bacterium]|nr:hypothetical protein [Deltaproteobacteria bacterium]
MLIKDHTITRITRKFEFRLPEKETLPQEGFEEANRLKELKQAAILCLKVQSFLHYGGEKADQRMRQAL